MMGGEEMGGEDDGREGAWVKNRSCILLISLSTNHLIM